MNKELEAAIEAAEKLWRRPVLDDRQAFDDWNVRFIGAVRHAEVALSQAGPDSQAAGHERLWRMQVVAASHMTYEHKLASRAEVKAQRAAGWGRKAVR